jgi:xanthine dehydrogenase accessory factor
MQVFVEPVLPRPTLWILGHGRIAESLCSLGAMMGLEVVVHDPLARPARFPDAAELRAEDMAHEKLHPMPGDFVVVASQRQNDHEALLHVLMTDVAYVALIASHKRSQIVLDHLRRSGVAPERVSTVRAPAGLELGARTPEEIALSVIGEIVRVRRASAAARENPALESDRRGAQDRGDESFRGRPGTSSPLPPSNASWATHDPSSSTRKAQQGDFHEPDRSDHSGGDITGRMSRPRRRA